MINDKYSEALREAYATADRRIIIIDTFELRHPSVPPVFVCNQKTDIQAYLEDEETLVTFEAAGMRYKLPAMGEDGLQSLEITIANVDRRISDYFELIRESDEPTELVYRPYRKNDLSKPDMNPPLILFLRDVKITPFQVSGSATFAEMVNRKSPNEKFTRQRFPNLGG